MSRQITSMVGGAPVTGGATHADLNPSDLADVVLEHGEADVEVARAAVAAAAEAFPGWSRTTPWQRSEVLDRAGTEVLARADELGDLLAREEGKTLPEARGEVVRAGQILKYFAGAALAPHGHVLDSVRPGVEVTVTREPLGVVSVITPWNFPIAIPAWKIAPALAFGNTVVFKPAELVPGSAWELVDILTRSGLPAGALNLVLGRGSVLGPTLTTDPAVNAVTFTGSVATGRIILDAPAPVGRKLQLELGGKNPLVVVDDADLAVAVECLVQGGFGSTGQRCTASSYAVVTDAVHDRFVEAVRERLGRWSVGDARVAGVDMGPVVDPTQLQQNLGYLDVARREGGEVLGGELVGGRARGPLHGSRPRPRHVAPGHHQPRGGVRPGRVGGPRVRLRRGARGRERQRDEPLRGDLHHRPRHRGALPAQLEGRDGHGEPAHRRGGLPRAVRRQGRLEPRPARAGLRRRGLLHHQQDGVHSSRRPDHLSAHPQPAPHVTGGVVASRLRKQPHHQ